VSDSSHNAITETKTRPRWRVFAVCLPLLATGCALNPSKITAVAATKDYAQLSCDELATEGHRIDARFVELRWSNKHGTRDEMAHLKGDAAAINDSIRINGCKLPSVKIPGQAWKEERK
jgi:hypothetical protein